MPPCYRLGMFALLLTSLTLASCSKPPMPLLQSPTPEVVISQPIIRTNMTMYDEYPGRIDSMYIIDIRARVDGYITKIGFRDGEEVEADKLLFEIDPRPYKAQYDITEAKTKSYDAQLKFADLEAKRNFSLLNSGGAASREDYERSVAKRDEASAGLNEAKASVIERKLYLDWTQVKAPKPGRLSKRNVDIGNLVSGNPTNGTLLTTLVGVDPMYVYFDVDERSVQRYRKLIREGKLGGRKVEGQHIEDAQLPVYIGLSTESGYPHVGVLDFVDNKVNPATGTLSVRGVIPNPNRTLQPGFFARVQILGGDIAKAVLVADRAIGTRQNERYVYVIDKDGKVESRTVELGRLIDGMRLITSGLDGEEWIIVDGLLRVQPGDKVETKKEDMPTPPQFNVKKPLPVPLVVPKEEKKETKSEEKN